MADHLILGKDGTILECWTLLSALASLTEKMRLGTLVLCPSHRHPALTAKMAATLDFISNGRVNYGVGAGWHKVEQLAYGLPWEESAAVRIDQMIEGIEIAELMWTEEKSTYEGRYYQIREAICEPKPVQKPHPPIWIGGGGEKLMLKAVAKHATGWNWSGSVALYKHKLGVLANHCSELGRNLQDILISWDGHILIARTREELRSKIQRIKSFSPNYPLSCEAAEIDPSDLLSESSRKKPTESQVYNFVKNNLVGTPEEVATRIQQYIEVGVTQFMLWFLDFPSANGIELFAKEVMPTFK